jgi:hypothetical protein
VFNDHPCMCAAFDGPSEQGELHPVEEHLTLSYPQPSDTAALPLWRKPLESENEDLPLDIVACCHVIATRTIPVLYNAADHPADAFSLMEELMPMIAVQPEARGTAAAAARLTEYLTGLLEVLELYIERDSMGMPEQDGLPGNWAHGELVDNEAVLGIESAHTLSLIMRFSLSLLNVSSASSPWKTYLL